jgi:hypothetical protein
MYLNLNGVSVSIATNLYQETCSSCPSSDERSIVVTSEQACISMPMGRLTVMSTVVQASELPFPTFRSKAFRPKTYVEIMVGGIHRRTQSVKQEKKTYTRWNFEVDL